MATKKKFPKQDPKLVSLKEKSQNEIKYIAKTFKIPVGMVRAAAKSVGRSRAKVYAHLREMGFYIPTRKFPKKIA